MYSRLDRTHRVLPVIFGVVTLAGVGVLFVWDALPRMFPAGSHDFLAAFPLVLIAFAYLAYQIAHRPARMEFAKAVMLAAAFLFWAANQLHSDRALRPGCISGDRWLAGDFAGRVLCRNVRGNP
jgi:O-antigen ligase